MKMKFNTFLLLLFGGIVILSSGCLADDPASPAAILTNNNITAAKMVTVTSTKTTVLADGKTATLITANCTVGDEPAPDGLRVEFRVDFGNFSDNGLDKLMSPNDHIVYRQTKGGKATVYLISYYRPVVATVVGVFAYTAWDTLEMTFFR